MHLGNKNPCVKYDLGGRELESNLKDNRFRYINYKGS